MAIHIINKINSRLRFLSHQNRFLNFPLQRLLCNAMIQPFFDYPCNAWYLIINKKSKMRLQAAQNKCIRFCLKLNDRSSMKSKDFEKIDWLQIHKRVSQCSLWSIYKLFTKKCHKKFDEIYAPIKTIKFTWGSLYQKLTLYQKLNVSHRKTNIGQKVLHYVGPSI